MTTPSKAALRAELELRSRAIAGRWNDAQRHSRQRWS